jgi:cytochrome c
MALTAGKRARPKVTLIATATRTPGLCGVKRGSRNYLEDPHAKMPGTKMIFSDKNEKEVADLWAYLNQFGTDGKKKSQ